MRRRLLMLGLFTAAAMTVFAEAQAAQPVPKSISLSNLAEEPLAPVAGPVEVPSMGFVTLRAEFPLAAGAVK